MSEPTHLALRLDRRHRGAVLVALRGHESSHIWKRRIHKNTEGSTSSE
jgi:hypothetical protein